MHTHIDAFEAALQRNAKIARANSFDRFWPKPMITETRKTPKAPEFTASDLTFRHNPLLATPKMQLDRARRHRARGGSKRFSTK